MADKILVADDDEAIGKLLVKVLSCNGFETKIVKNGIDALQELRSEAYSALILDVTMPELDGFQVLKRIRQEGNSIPVIVVSGKNEDYDVLYGLDIGADDYVNKPFNPVVLGAKVKAVVRRSRQHAEGGAEQVIKAGPFSFDTTTMHFYKNGAEVILSSKELQLMKLFMEHPKQVFSKEDLYAKVWGDVVVDDNAIMVYINRLRNKIEDNPKKPVYIDTVWGIGYSFSV